MKPDPNDTSWPRYELPRKRWRPVWKGPPEERPHWPYGSDEDESNATQHENLNTGKTILKNKDKEKNNDIVIPPVSRGKQTVGQQSEIKSTEGNDAQMVGFSDNLQISPIEKNLVKKLNTASTDLQSHVAPKVPLGHDPNNSHVDLSSQIASQISSPSQGPLIVEDDSSTQLASMLTLPQYEKTSTENDDTNILEDHSSHLAFNTQLQLQNSSTNEVVSIRNEVNDNITTVEHQIASKNSLSHTIRPDQVNPLTDNTTEAHISAPQNHTQLQVQSQTEISSDHLNHHPNASTSLNNESTLLPDRNQFSLPINNASSSILSADYITSLQNEYLMPKRNLRKRTDAQLHPYTYELAYYKTQIRKHGIKPTVIVESAPDDTIMDPTVRFLQQPELPHEMRTSSKRAQSQTPETLERRAKKRALRKELEKKKKSDLENESEDDETILRRHRRRHRKMVNRVHVTDDEDSMEEITGHYNSEDNNHPEIQSLQQTNELNQPILQQQIPENQKYDEFFSHGGNDKDEDSIQKESDDSSDSLDSISSGESLSPSRLQAIPPTINTETPATAIFSSTARRMSADSSVTSKSFPVKSVQRQDYIRPNHRPVDDFSDSGALEYDVIDRMLQRGSSGTKKVEKRYGHSKSQSSALRNYGSSSRQRTIKVTNGRPAFDQQYRLQTRRPRKLNSMASIASKKQRYTSTIVQSNKRLNYTKSNSTQNNNLSKINDNKSHNLASNENPESHRNLAQSTLNMSTPGLHSAPFNNSSFNQQNDNVNNGNDTNLDSSGNNVVAIEGIQVEREIQLEAKKHKNGGGRGLIAVVSGIHSRDTHPKRYTRFAQIESGEYAIRNQGTSSSIRFQRQTEEPVYNFPVKLFRLENSKSDQGKNSNQISSKEKVLNYLKTVSYSIPSEVQRAQSLNDLMEEDNNSWIENSHDSSPQLKPEVFSPADNNIPSYSKLEPDSVTKEPELFSDMKKNETYPYTFGGEPLKKSASWFEENSFIGSGTFQLILEKTISDDMEETLEESQNSSSKYFGTEIGDINWVCLNQEVVTKFKDSCDIIIGWLSEDSVTSEKLESAYHFLSFATRFIYLNTSTVSFIASNGSGHAEQVFEIVNTALDKLLSIQKTAPMGSSYSQLHLMSIFLLVPVYFIPKVSSFVVGNSLTLTQSLKTLLKRILSEFPELISQLESSPKPISWRTGYLLEAGYICARLMDRCGDLIQAPTYGKFLTHVHDCVKSTMLTSPPLRRNEAIWSIVFHFNALYSMSGETPADGWKAINKLVIPFFDALRPKVPAEEVFPGIKVTNSMIAYLKALLARCINLCLKWSWSPDMGVAKAAYACFSAIGYANLEPNETKDEITPIGDYTQICDDDTVFKAFLKLFAVMVRGYKRQGKNRQLRKLMELINVLNNFRYPPRTESLQRAQSQSLSNQYSLLLTRYVLASKETQPPLQQLASKFTISNSHLHARLIVLDAWVIVARLQISRNHSMKAAMKWYDDLLGEALNEYEILVKEKGAASHLNSYESYIFQALDAVHALLSRHNVENLLTKSTQWALVLRKLHMKVLSLDIVPVRLRAKVLKIMRSYIYASLDMKTLQPSESKGSSLQSPDLPYADSQEIDFALPDARDNHIKLLANRFATVASPTTIRDLVQQYISAEPPNNLVPDWFLIDLLQTWAFSAELLVPTAISTTKAYYYAWQWYQKSVKRTRLEPCWMANVVTHVLKNDIDYLEVRKSVLNLLMKSLVVVVPVHESKLITAVLNREASLESGWFRDVERNKGRLTITIDIVKELGIRLKNTRLEYRNLAEYLLTSLSNALKTNCLNVLLVSKNYFAFTMQIVEAMMYHCPTHNVDWFLDPTHLNSLATSSSSSSDDNELYTLSKITQFKKLLQIDFSNIYNAGYKLMYYFCLELQNSVVAGDTIFERIMTTALSLSEYTEARRLLVSQFMSIYILEAIDNSAVRYTLRPVLGTINELFDRQACAGRMVDLEVGRKLYEILEAYIVLRDPQAMTDSDWLAVETFFKLREYLKPGLTSALRVALCFLNSDFRSLQITESAVNTVAKLRQDQMFYGQVKTTFLGQYQEVQGSLVINGKSAHATTVESIKASAEEWIRRFWVWVFGKAKRKQKAKEMEPNVEAMLSANDMGWIVNDVCVGVGDVLHAII